MKPILYRILEVDTTSVFYPFYGEMIGLTGCMRRKVDDINGFSSGIFYFCGGSPFDEPMLVLDRVKVEAITDTGYCPLVGLHLTENDDD